MTDSASIHPLWTMRQVLERFPGAQRALFRKYHIGGCSSCGFQPEETLAGVCQRNNKIPVAEAISEIERSHQEDLKIWMTPRELAELKASGHPCKVVDIRTREEWEAARIQGSLLFTQDLMNEMLGRWPREELIVLCDHLGKKSLDAAAYFLGHGFQKVRALQGGVDAWSSQVDQTIPRYRLEAA